MHMQVKGHNPKTRSSDVREAGNKTTPRRVYELIASVILILVLILYLIIEYHVTINLYFG